MSKKNKKNKKNILLLSMSTLYPTLTENYYDFSEKAEDLNSKYYFRGVSQLEPGTKYFIRMLQKEKKHLDKVFILASSAASRSILDKDQPSINLETEKDKGKKDKEKRRTELDGRINMIYHNPGDDKDELEDKVKNAVEFYKTRIIQYLNGQENKGRTEPDVSEKLSKRDSLENKVREYEKKISNETKLTGQSFESLYKDINPDDFFTVINLEDEDTDMEKDPDGDTIQNEYRYIYKAVNDLCTAIKAEDYKSKEEDGRQTYKKDPTEVDESKITLFVDMQGARRNDTFVINAALNMLEMSGIYVRQSVAIDYDRDNNGEGRFNHIVDTTTNDQIFEMVSGLNEFKRTGRGDTLYNLVDTWGSKRPFHLKSFLRAEKDVIEKIKDISDAISICDVEKFDESLGKFNITYKEYIKNYDENKDANPLFKTIVDDLYKEYTRYGLINEESTEIKISPMKQIYWCLKKGLYQQALTIIEARIPNDMVENSVVYYKDNGNTIKTLLNDAYSPDKKWLNGVPKYTYVPDNNDNFLYFKEKYINYVWINYAIHSPNSKKNKPEAERNYEKGLVLFNRKFQKQYEKINEIQKNYKLNEQLSNVLLEYQELKSYRNDVNHTQLDKGQSTDETERDKLKVDLNPDMLKKEIIQFLKDYNALLKKKLKIDLSEQYSYIPNL